MGKDTPTSQDKCGIIDCYKKPIHVSGLCDEHEQIRLLPGSESALREMLYHFADEQVDYLKPHDPLIDEAVAYINRHYTPKTEQQALIDAARREGFEQAGIAVEDAITEFGDQVPLVFKIIEEQFHGDGERNVR